MGNTLYNKRAFLGSEWIEGLKKTGNGYVKTPRPGRAGLRHAPRIIELYQIFPFIVNYGTIRMELWIGCAPLPLDGFRRVRPQTSFNLLMSWIPLDGSYLARIHYDEVSVALMHSCQFKKGG